MKTPNPGPVLRRLRSERGLSLEQTGELTGVSRPMLSQIERGTSSPTITTLWKIAAGLKVPLSIFVKEEPALIEKGEETAPLLAEEGKMTARLLFPFDPSRSTEVWQVKLDPGCTHVSEGHAPDTEEYILMEEGTVNIQVEDEKEQLLKGEVLRFRADTGHSYSTDSGCCFFNVIFYGKDA